MFRVLLLLCLSVCLAVAKNEQYEGHSMYEIITSNLEQTKLVNQLENDLPVDMWSKVLPGRAGQVLVPQNVKDSFEKALKALGVEFKVAVENIKEQIDLEDELIAEATRKSNSSQSRAANGFPFDTIHRYDVVDAYLVELASRYPSIVQVASAGKSFEGRDIKYLKISSTNFQDHSKPVVMMESLLHSREWIGLAATLYSIHKLVLDVTEPDLLRDIDWIILPIANPDGYEFSHTSGRLWRKNRNTNYGLGIGSCMGVDLNRNFDIHFGQASSSNVCTDTFHGSGPFSEPESANVRNIILEHSHRLELFLDIHSFGSWILYGYGNGVLPPNGLSIHVAGIRMANAIDHVKLPSNPNYVVGNVASILYPASGSAQDYAQIVGGTLSYTYELPAYRNQGGFMGFLVDTDFIEQAGFETWEGIKAGARYALENFKAKNMKNSK